MPSLPVEPGAVVAERDRLQPGESRGAGRRLVLPRRIGNWSLTSLQQRLVKTGGRLVKHARYYWLLLAESPISHGGSSEPCWAGSQRCPCPLGKRADDRIGFERRERHGAAECRQHRSKTGRFRSLGFSAEAKRHDPLPVGSPGSADPRFSCVRRRSAVCYRAKGTPYWKFRFTRK
jgi:hypothetical protein